jgi:hypothetical protein
MIYEESKRKFQQMCTFIYQIGLFQKILLFFFKLLSTATHTKNSIYTVHIGLATTGLVIVGPGPSIIWPSATPRTTSATPRITKNIIESLQYGSLADLHYVVP